MPATLIHVSPTAGRRQTQVEMTLSMLDEERNAVPTVWGGHLSATASRRTNHSSAVRGGTQSHIGVRRSDEISTLPASVHKQAVRRSLDDRRPSAVVSSPRIRSKMYWKSHFSSANPCGESSSSSPERPHVSLSPNLTLLKMLVQPSDKVRKRCLMKDFIIIISLLRSWPAVSARSMSGCLTRSS